MSSRSNTSSFSAVRLRRAIKEKPTTGKALAATLSVSENTVSSWTTGASRPRKRHLEALAREFETPVSDFLDDPAATADPGSPSGRDRPELSAEEIVRRLTAIDTQPAASALTALTRDLEAVLDAARRYTRGD